MVRLDRAPIRVAILLSDWLSCKVLPPGVPAVVTRFLPRRSSDPHLPLGQIVRYKLVTGWQPLRKCRPPDPASIWTTLFVGYLQDPTPGKLSRVEICASRGARIRSLFRDLGRAEHFFRQSICRRRTRAAPTHASEPRAQPWAHLKLALVYQRLDRTGEMERERAIAIRCIEGILSTGDGSMDRPYRVTRTSDEYDVLVASNLTWASQTLRQAGKRRLDVVRTREGQEICST